MKICECFLSIQGEGLMMGSLTYFVRTVGCNLDCSWCDTLYSKNEAGTDMTPAEIMEVIGDVKGVCVTGGEPLLQKDMPELLNMLANAGKTVVLETNGSIDISEVPDNDGTIVSMDIKCPSSGMQDRMNFKNLVLLKKKDQLKFVIGDENDLEYAIKFIGEHPTEANVIFSPVGGMELLPLAERVVDDKLDVRVLPQLHKIIWGDKRSV